MCVIQLSAIFAVVVQISMRYMLENLEHDGLVWRNLFPELNVVLTRSVRACSYSDTKSLRILVHSFQKPHDGIEMRLAGDVGVTKWVTLICSVKLTCF